MTRRTKIVSCYNSNFCNLLCKNANIINNILDNIANINCYKLETKKFSIIITGFVLKNKNPQ